MKKIIFLALVALLGIHTVDVIAEEAKLVTPETETVEKAWQEAEPVLMRPGSRLLNFITEFFKKELSR